MLARQPDCIISTPGTDFDDVLPFPIASTSNTTPPTLRRSQRNRCPPVRFQT